MSKTVFHDRAGKDFLMKIALLGYGTVGQSVAKLLSTRRTGIELKTILRRKGKADAANMTDCYADILGDPEIDAVVEVLSGKDPAANYIRQALSAGKHVVSANKAALASDFPALLKLAEKQNVSLLYEASCGGGIPWLENIKKAAAFDHINAVSGILNGTGNYIIDRMESEGAEFSEALSSAQALGYAEADPTADIGGYDIRNKALISCTLAYGGEITADFPVLGIEKLTKAVLGLLHAQHKSLRLMMYSVRRENAYAVGVAPIVLPDTSVEAHVQKNFNCAALCGDVVGELKFYGQGAGGFPTADAVIQDLILIRDKKAVPVKLQNKLCYEEALLSGTGYFAESSAQGTQLVARTGTLAELSRAAKAKDVFMAFEPAPLS